jgi:membrane protein DedA with SNARE-associated domain
MDPLASFIDWIGNYGILGLLALGVFERFVPVLPSYGVLVAVGIAAAQGEWPAATAFVGTVIGSLAGCLLLYWLALALGQERSYRWLIRAGRCTGMRPAQVDRLIASFEAQQRNLSFGAQLVPVVRLMAPVIAGLFRADARPFLTGTAAGVVLWNGLFLGVGHAAARWSGTETNASTLALKVLVVLVAVETACVFAWRWRTAAAATATTKLP